MLPLEVNSVLAVFSLMSPAHYLRSIKSETFGTKINLLASAQIINSDKGFLLLLLSLYNVKNS